MYLSILGKPTDKDLERYPAVQACLHARAAQWAHDITAHAVTRGMTWAMFSL